MGLDIIVYKNAKFVQKEQPKDYENSDLQYVFNMPNCSQNVEQEGYYSVGERENVYSRPYSTYNRHRNQLAQLVGTSDKEIWANPSDTTPFVQIINFPDCEGSIDAKTCQKLLGAFEHYKELAIKYEDADFVSFYEALHQGIKTAALSNGIIQYR